MSSPESEKAESDVEPDPKVAGSRASEGDDDQADGPYVGRAGSDDDIDTQESAQKRVPSRTSASRRARRARRSARTPVP